MRIDVHRADFDLLDMKILNKVLKGGMNRYRLAGEFRGEHIDDVTIYQHVDKLVSSGRVSFAEPERQGELTLTESGRLLLSSTLDKWIPLLEARLISAPPGTVEGSVAISIDGKTTVTSNLAKIGTVLAILTVGSVQVGSLVTSGVDFL